MEISYGYLAYEDIGQAAALERQAFSQPWSEGGMKHYMDAGQTLFIAAKDGDVLAGYAAVMCILDEGNLVSIVVDPAYRQLGIGAELLDVLYEQLRDAGVTGLFLEVRQSNVPAIALYEKEGFEKTGIRKGFYDRPKEDAILYVKKL